MRQVNYILKIFLTVSLLTLLSESCFAIGIAPVKPTINNNTLKITQRAGENRFRDNNGRLLRNHRFAGKTIPIRKIAPKLALRYRKPIKFNKYGYPDFSPYSTKDVKTMRLTGNHQKDVRIVERILKQKNPRWKRKIGYTWHHHQDGKTMQYVPTKLHSAIPHSGGASRLRAFKNN